VHGLLSFLDNKHIATDNLITVDIVCHGVPSRKLWREYVAETERRHKLDIIRANFRNKELFGWKDHKESFVFSDTTTTTTTGTTSFYSHVMFRESCYACPYTTPYRNSDITIADYWGIENNASEFDDDKGVNLLIIHTKKGHKLFEKIKGNLLYSHTELSTSMQPNLQHPSKKDEEFANFWQDYSRLSTRSFFAKYFFSNKFTRLKRRLNNKIKRTARIISKINK
jgi:coenzyme F420-reducing hydrogenase beta subunit